MSRLSRWQVNNNNNSRITGRVVCRLLSSCNIANAGIAHPTTSNLEILFLREDSSAPFHWTTAFINNVHPGADGNMSGHYQNPKGHLNILSKICPFPHVKNEL